MLSLSEVFAQARQLWQISDPAPTVTIALHRLLLAILHRSLNGPRDRHDWANLWRASQFDVDRINGYLNDQRGRFDLFDKEQPFYQTPELDQQSAKSIVQLTHERASDKKKPLLTDHTLDGASMSPDAAARYLIAQQSFSAGGTISYNTKTERPAEAKFAKATPLLGCAIALVKGRNVFETLMLNWLQYSRESEQPFPFSAHADAPAWERIELTKPEERSPDGYVDLLTWQSRRILLFPSTKYDGSVEVQQVALMKGYSFPPGLDWHSHETMVAFRKRPRARENEPPWIPVMLRADRVIWRDSDALLGSVGDGQQARTLGWLATLMTHGILSEDERLPLDIYGLIPDQAKIEDWRQESLPLPLQFLKIPGLVMTLREAIELAERMRRLLEPGLLDIQLPTRTLKGPSPVRVFAQELLTGTSERRADTGAVGSLGQHISMVRDFWARLDEPFRRLVVSLPADVSTGIEGDIIYGAHARLAWGAAVERAARDAFAATLRGYGTTVRELRAVAMADSRFGQCVAALMRAWRAE
jgi:CRISPR system Cascade subunit CasA